MRMIYDCFPVLLAASVTCLSLVSNNSFLGQRGKKYGLIMPTALAQSIETKSLSQPAPKLTVAATDLEYQSFMQAGYTADQNKDYLTALKHFENALAIRPNDSIAKQAIRNVTSYAFDSYMQSGYFADRQRDYETALKYFQQAIEIRPDSFHAQQAIRNVNSYLIANRNDELDSQQSDSNNNGIWLILMVMLCTAGVTAVILSLLFKKNNSDSRGQYVNSFSPEEEVETVVAPAKNYPEVIKPSSANDTTVVQTTKHNSSREERENTQIFTTEGNMSKLHTSESKSVRESQLVSSQNSSVSKLDIIPELIEDLKQSDRALRRKTIWELAQRSDSRAMKPLVELMIEVDSQERSLILEAMTQIASRTLKPMNRALTLSLKDDNSQVRQNAIRDLTRVYELMSQVTQRLSLAVEDSDEEVQQTAKWALKQLNQMPQVTWQNSTNSSDDS